MERPRIDDLLELAVELGFNIIVHQRDAWRETLEEKARHTIRRYRRGQALADERYAVAARHELAEVDAELKAIGYEAAEHDRLRQLEHTGEHDRHPLAVGDAVLLDQLQRLVRQE